MSTPTLAQARQFSLASLLASYPSDDFAGTVADLPLAEHPGAGPMWTFLADGGSVDDVRSMYVELFDRGGDRASLHETEYGRMAGMSKGSDLADIAGFYRAFGLDLDPEHSHEALDHVAVELEFYSMLLTKQAHLDALGNGDGSAIVLDARRKFLADHLGRFVAAIGGQRAVKESAIYGAAFTWIGQLVADECALVGVKPPPLDFFADPESNTEMTCGSVRLPVVQ